MYWILPALDSAACLGLGLFVFSRSRRKTANIVFLMTMVCIALFEGAMAVSLALGPERIPGWLLPLQVSFLVASLWAAVAFSMIFGHRDAGPVLRSKRTLSALHLTAGAVVIGWSWSILIPAELP